MNPFLYLRQNAYDYAWDNNHIIVIIGINRFNLSQLSIPRPKNSWKTLTENSSRSSHIDIISLRSLIKQTGNMALT